MTNSTLPTIAWAPARPGLLPPSLSPVLCCPTGPYALPEAWTAVGLLAAGWSFLAAVDAAGARVGLALGLADAWGRAAACRAASIQAYRLMVGVAAQAQRPTEASARGVRHHAYADGLPVAGGAR